MSHDANSGSREPEEIREQVLHRVREVVDATMANESIENVIREQYGNITQNHGEEPEGLLAYGLRKIARYAASIAYMQAKGLDPALLKVTDEEFMEHQMGLALAFLAADKEVIVAHPD